MYRHASLLSSTPRLIDAHDYFDAIDYSLLAIYF